MSTYENSIVIERPIDVVFKNTTCLRGCINWQTSVLNTEQISEGPTQVGSRFRHSLKFMGIAGITQPEVTVYNPPYEFAYKDPDARVAFTTHYSFEAVPEGTRVTVLIDSALSQSALGRLALPLFLNALRRQFDVDMATLKELLEDDVTVHAT